MTISRIARSQDDLEEESVFVNVRFFQGMNWLALMRSTLRLFREQLRDWLTTKERGKITRWYSASTDRSVAFP